ncbi:MAG TPA: hypothetical protein VEA78_03370 [Acidimicrobiales bacterium]|nr:hypothetical protein [Acidimicrobiales bacterium]
MRWAQRWSWWRSVWWSWWPARRRVVRTRRLEVVDAGGRVRAVLGPAVVDGGGGEGFGLWLRDDGGGARVWLGVDGAGAALAVGRDGTVVAGLGTIDPGPDAVHVGSHVFVADRDGRTAAGWYVHDVSGLHVVGLDEPP